MKGVIFAAGLGTRLYPLTKDKPKALVEVAGEPMLGHTLKRLQTSGITDVVVNVHAFADEVEDYLKDYSTVNPDMNISISDERDLLLETGGGLKKMQPLLSDDTFLVHNVDVISTIDLDALKNADRVFFSESVTRSTEKDLDIPLHLATLAVHQTQDDRCFLFNERGLLCGWENVKTGEQKISRPDEKNLKRYGFTGIHLVHPELFRLMIEEGVFSITDVYLRLAKNYDIRMLDVSEAIWFDIGSPQQLKKAEQEWVK